MTMLAAAPAMPHAAAQAGFDWTAEAIRIARKMIDGPAATAPPAAPVVVENESDDESDDDAPAPVPEKKQKKEFVLHPAPPPAPDDAPAAPTSLELRDLWLTLDLETTPTTTVPLTDGAAWWPEGNKWVWSAKCYSSATGENGETIQQMTIIENHFVSLDAEVVKLTANGFKIHKSDMFTLRERQRQFYRHRIVASTFHPPPLPEQIEVDHKFGRVVSAENPHPDGAMSVRWATKQQNATNKTAEGRVTQAASVQTALAKPVIARRVADNTVVHEYDSCTDAAAAHGVIRHVMGRRIKNESVCGGLVFTYKFKQASTPEEVVAVLQSIGDAREGEIWKKLLYDRDGNVVKSLLVSSEMRIWRNDRISAAESTNEKGYAMLGVGGKTELIHHVTAAILFFDASLAKMKTWLAEDAKRVISHDLDDKTDWWSISKSTQKDNMDLAVVNGKRMQFAVKLCVSENGDDVFEFSDENGKRRRAVFASAADASRVLTAAKYCGADQGNISRSLRTLATGTVHYRAGTLHHAANAAVQVWAFPASAEDFS